MELLLHSVSEMDWGKFHPLFVHFPIVLFSCALISDVLYGINRKGAFYVGHWLIFGGTVMFIPTIVTGLYASESFDSQDPYLYLHKILGFASGIAGAAYAGIRWAAMREKWVFPPVVYVILSLIVVSLIYWTSDYGGLLTRTSTPFSSRENVSEGKAHHNEEDLTSLSGTELYTHLSSEIGVADVIPIFNKAHCIGCHSDKFEGGHPVNFSAGPPEQVFFFRNADGTLKDVEKSPFYQMVIVRNQMPMNHDHQPLGLSYADRLILLQWLKNNAPSGG